MILIVYGYFTNIFTFYILFYIPYFNVKHDSNNLRYFTNIFTFYTLFYISYFNVEHDSNNLRLFYKYIYILYPILHLIF